MHYMKSSQSVEISKCNHVHSLGLKSQGLMPGVVIVSNYSIIILPVSVMYIVLRLSITGIENEATF